MVETLRKKILLFSVIQIFLCICSFSGIYSENNQKVIHLSSELYQEMKAVYLDAGLSMPFSSFPWTKDEFLRALDRVPVAALSGKGKTLFSHILSELKERPFFKEEGGRFSFDMSLEFNLESYLHTNNNPSSWTHGFEERLPLLNLPIEFWFFDSFYMDVEIGLKEEYRAISEDNNNHWNIFRKFNNIDWYFPSRAFLSVGGEHWNIQLGRDQLEWGNGQNGNLMLSDYSEFHDFLKFTTYWKNFKFTTLYIVTDAWASNWEKDLYDANGDGDFEGEPDEQAAFDKDFGTTYKAFFGHRFEFRMFKRLGLALTESVIFGNTRPELRDFSPLMIFHNWFIPERTNSLITIDVDLNPYKYCDVYFQYAIDEFKTSYEKAGGNTKPGANGMLAGITCLIPIWKGYLNGTFEWAKTDPWLYNHENPLMRHTSRRRIWSYISPDGYEYIEKPLGLEEGADAIVWFFTANYRLPDKFGVGFDFKHVKKGEHNYKTDYDTGQDAVGLKTPTGSPKKSAIFHLYGDYTPWSCLNLGTHFYWIKGHHEDFEWIFYLKFDVKELCDLILY